MASSSIASTTSPKRWRKSKSRSAFFCSLFRFRRCNAARSTDHEAPRGAAPERFHESRLRAHFLHEERRQGGETHRTLSGPLARRRGYRPYLGDLERFDDRANGAPDSGAFGRGRTGGVLLSFRYEAYLSCSP